jgi:hypothetical protein
VITQPTTPATLMMAIIGKMFGTKASLSGSMLVPLFG